MISGVVSASIGKRHSSMIKSDGSMWVMGSHRFEVNDILNYFMKVVVFPVIKTGFKYAGNCSCCLDTANLPPQKAGVDRWEDF